MPDLHCKMSAGVDIAGIMLGLRRTAQREGWVMAGEKLPFYKTFVDMIKKKGRINELHLGLAVAMKTFPSAHPMEDAVLFLKLLKRGKLK